MKVNAGTSPPPTPMAPPSMPAPPDLDKYREVTTETVRALIGTNPQDVLDLYLEAQQRAGKIRDKIKDASANMASYKARYWASGSGSSHFDMERKALLAKLSREERDRRAANQEKVTVAELDDFANSDRRYLEFLKNEEKGRWEMERQQAELAGLREDLETALGAVEYYSKAHKSCDSYIWFAREENRKTF